MELPFDTLIDAKNAIYGDLDEETVEATDKQVASFLKQLFGEFQLNFELDGLLAEFQSECKNLEKRFDTPNVVRKGKKRKANVFEFDTNLGNVILNGKQICNIKPDTRDFKFFAILYANIGKRLPYREIVDQMGMPNKGNADLQNFCL